MAETTGIGLAEPGVGRDHARLHCCGLSLGMGDEETGGRRVPHVTFRRFRRKEG